MRVAVARILLLRLFTEGPSRCILRSSSMNSSYGGCVAPLFGGIMLVVERVMVRRVL
jgi:hypothetical protein